MPARPVLATGGAVALAPVLPLILNAHHRYTGTAPNTNASGFYRRLGFRPLQLADPPETPVLHLARLL